MCCDGTLVFWRATTLIAVSKIVRIPTVKFLWMLWQRLIIVLAVLGIAHIIQSYCWYYLCFWRINSFVWSFSTNCYCCCIPILFPNVGQWRLILSNGIPNRHRNASQNSVFYWIQPDKWQLSSSFTSSDSFLFLALFICHAAFKLPLFFSAQPLMWVSLSGFTSPLVQPWLMMITA